MYISYNEELIHEDQNIFSAKNRVFNYGDGFFDSLLCFNKIPKFFDDHIKRMESAAKALRLNYAVDKDVLQKQIEKLLEKNNLVNARVRITVYRTDGGLYTPEINNASVLIVCKPAEELPFLRLAPPRELCFVESIAKNFSAFSSFKNCNSLTYVVAGIEIKERGFPDGVILNSAGRLCEVLHSNLFFIRRNTIYTPAVTEGCIDGVMRKFIIENVPGTFHISEGMFTRDYLMRADEVFITNAVYGVVPVSKIEDSTFSSHKTKVLFKHFSGIYY